MNYPAELRGVADQLESLAIEEDDITTISVGSYALMECATGTDITVSNEAFTRLFPSGFGVNRSIGDDYEHRVAVIDGTQITSLFPLLAVTS